MQLINDSYYAVCLNFNFKKIYLIWISEDDDGVLVDENKKLVGFDNKQIMLKYAKKHDFVISEDVTTYKIDELQQWILTPTEQFDPKLFLNFWNLCTDIAISVKKSFVGDVRNRDHDNLYDKLFNAAGPVFMIDDPEVKLSLDELFKLKEVIENGLTLLLDNLVVK